MVDFCCLCEVINVCAKYLHYLGILCKSHYFHYKNCILTVVSALK